MKKVFSLFFVSMVLACSFAEASNSYYCVARPHYSSRQKSPGYGRGPTKESAKARALDHCRQRNGPAGCRIQYCMPEASVNYFFSDMEFLEL